jgi:hypothetical protein
LRTHTACWPRVIPPMQTVRPSSSDPEKKTGGVNLPRFNSLIISFYVLLVVQP